MHQQTRRFLYSRYPASSNPSVCTMGRQKRRKLINIQNLNRGSGTSKRQKTTASGNSDSEVTGKYRGHRILPNDIMEELGKNGIV